MTELSSDAKKLFDEARAAYEPPAARLDTARVAIQSRLMAEGAGATATQAANGAGATATVSKLVVVLVAASAAVGTYLASRGAEAPQVAMPVAAPSVAAPPAGPRIGTGAAVAPAPAHALADENANVQARGEATGTRSGAAYAASTPKLPALAKLNALRSTTSHDRRAYAPKLPAVAAKAAERPEPAPAPAADTTEPAQPSAAAEPRPASQVAEPASADTLAEELALMREARALLDRGQAFSALELLRKHTLRFPKGTLREERLTLQVLASCKLGRKQDAREAAAMLRRIAPHSPHLGRIAGSCAGAQP